MSGMSGLRLLAIATLAGSGLLACKPDEPTCKPGEVEWGVQLLIEATAMINVDRNGQPLPTVVRLYQVRGELVLDELDFETLWAAEDTKALGEGFVSVEEMTIYPGQRDQRLLPVEPEATHFIAAAWFREPMGNTWFASYEIPRRHPEVVCDRAPENRVYPNPCMYVLLDRSLTSGGPTPPSGFSLVAGVQCAPPGVVPGTAKDDGKKKKKKKRKKSPGCPTASTRRDCPRRRACRRPRACRTCPRARARRRPRAYPRARAHRVRPCRARRADATGVEGPPLQFSTGWPVDSQTLPSHVPHASVTGP
jgi:type VI secretion system VasD/TssJ family lipoprotein